MSTFEQMMQVLGDRVGVDANRLVETVRSVKSRRQRRGRVAGRAGNRAVSCGRAEQLEPRLPMTIDVFTSGYGGAVGDTRWFVITSDKADDVYIQKVATVPQDLLIADNPSFNNAQSLDAYHADGALWNGEGGYGQMYATNGTKVSISEVLPVDNSDGLQSVFVLSQKIPDRDTTAVGVIGGVRGTVAYAGNRWNFSNGGAGSSLAFTLASTGTISDPTLIYPEFGQVGLTAGGSAGPVSDVSIQWSAPAVAAAGVTAPTISSITYDIAAATATAPATTLSEFGLANSTGSQPVVQLPVTPVNPGGIVPGTLSGVLVVDGFPRNFQMYSLFPLVGEGSRLLFYNDATPSLNGLVTINRDTANPKVVNVVGTVDYDRGTIALKFTDGEGGPAINPGAVSVSFVNYAVYNQDAAASSFTFAPGQTFEQKSYVDLLTPGSTIAINSRIRQIAPPKGNGELSLRATNINFNAEVQASEYLDIGSTDPTRVNRLDRRVIAVGATAAAIVNTSQGVSAISVAPGSGGQGYDDSAPLDVQLLGGGGSGATAVAYSLNGVINRVVVTDAGSGYSSLPTVIIPSPQATDASENARLVDPAEAYAEQVTFNAKVTAPNYDIRIADDPSTLAIRRGRLLVTSSGSLIADDGAGGVAAAGSLFVQAETSDVYVEGTINATRQSYLFRSPSDSELLAPFVFTTASPYTGVNTGLIQGGTVAITLGNDLKTSEQQSVASNTVDLRTRIDSLRVTAATRQGDPMSGPFPYDLTISEQGDISFDAVASSGQGISLAADGSIGLTSAVTTWGDLSITAGGNFNLTAPISSARGKIAIVADALTVSNSLRVLDSLVDATRDDITLTSTGGDLALTGAIAAVNNVRLVQRNALGLAGSIAGPSRIIAHGINVEAEGSANLRTDAVTLSGRANGDFTVDELNDITITSLRTPGLVTLRAGGTDPGLENTFTPNTIALQATLYDVTSLDVSAPRGSVAITTDTSKTLTLGKTAAIVSGTATGMQAAGGVSIRSLAGPVIVADAPVAGGSAITARFAFTDNLSGLYNQGTPGLFASTLTGDRAPLVNEEGLACAVGDRILLSGQANQNENGVYVVKVSGSLGRNWVLTRASDADTSGELVSGSYVRVLEGSHAEAIYTVGYASTTGDSLLAVSTVPNRAGAEPVRVATTSTLAGSYDSAAATISGPGDLPLIDGVSLSVGDRLLVRMGTIDTPPAGTSTTPLPVSAANGVYEVVAVGGVGGTWLLARATNIDNGSAIETGYVLTTEGSFRAAATGQVFAVAYESLGIDPLYFTQLMPGELVTNIGTEDFNDLTTFVVSSAAGSNNAAGSFGKMISLRQTLDTSSSSLNPSPKVDFAFSSTLPGVNGGSAGVIRLTQELPAISKAFAINGASRVRMPGETGPAVAGITIDGSRITTTRTGQPAAGAAEVNGFEFVSGSQSTVGSAGGSVANLTIGGFANGSAVKINGVEGILVNKVVLGRSETGDRLINKFGVRAAGAGAEGTVSGSTIVGSTQAGIRTESDAAGLTIVGTTVGVLNQGNADGIQLDGGTSRVGLSATVDTKSFIQTFSGQKAFSLPPAISPRNLHLGQSVSGPGIPAGTTIAAINGSMVTLSKAMTVTVRTKGIRFSSPSRNTVQFNLSGLVLSGGNNVVSSTDIGKNAYDGIRATGGIQTIGTAKKVNNVSNGIYGNGRSGVVIEGAPQIVVQGNYLGVKGKNQLANIVANGLEQPTPKTKTRLDANGNFHACWR